ncbi:MULTISPECIES: acyl carrier protein [Acidithrix]|uniref:Acyl carrier protein n=1 Tax=mine drainage metagenome TaxID=410659 RepID=T0ZFU0_9ZZZZ|nr:MULTISPECIES: acyl carrier protein [Acidithrix]
MTPEVNVTGKATYSTKDEIFESIKNNLADILEIDPSGILINQSFTEDLSADSLALIELVEAMEEEFSGGDHTFRIEDEDLEDLKTVFDAVEYVAAKLEILK